MGASEGGAEGVLNLGSIEKARTGIVGLDEITGGGIPTGRASLLLGAPGAGKTVMALQTLVNGDRHHGEPGIFVAFEENSRQIIRNAASFGWDLPSLQREGLFFLDAHLSPTVVQSGEFDLGGMLASLTAKAEEMGARRIVFDGIDVLLALLDGPGAARREMYRLYEWIHQQEVTALITAKAEPGEIPGRERYAFMQFMMDCVILLQHSLAADRVSLRTVRVMKYRGSGFRENQFPLVIGPRGMEISTFGSADLRYQVGTERVSSGIPRLDSMMSGGYHRASSVLVSGVPGTAKTTLAGAFTRAACQRGERALFVSFDEAAEQIVRNLRSVAIDLGEHVDARRLLIHGARTESRGAEEHLLALRHLLDEFEPQVLVLDPISALMKSGGQVSASHAAVRLLDLAKSRGITTLCTTLTSGGDPEEEATTMQISTIADTWIHLAYVARGGERNRTLTIIKSRGTRHSNQVRELLLNDDGVRLADVYRAGGEVLVGTARWEKEAEMRDAERQRRLDAERRQRELELLEAEIEGRMAALQRELEVRRVALGQEVDVESRRRQRRYERSAELLRRRDADADTEPAFAPLLDGKDGE